MKKLLAILIALPMLAFAGVSPEIGYSSDYIWRGQSQSLGAGSLHSGLLFESDSGFYTGAWAGQVDFGDDTASWEYDLYGGYVLNVSNKISLNAGIIQYRYDDKSIDKTEEAFIIASSDRGSFSYYVDTDDSDASYIEVGVNVPFIKVVDVAFNVGEFKDETRWTGVSFEKSMGKVSLSLMILEEAKNGQFSDNVSLGFTYSI